MARSLWLFNLLLALLASALAWTLAGSLAGAPGAGGEPEPSAADVRPAAAAQADASPQVTASVAPLSEFDVILARDAFKNPLAAAPAPPPLPRPVPPPPPLPPLPTLVGTIFVGEERKAILSSNNRSEIYALGQSVAGGAVVKIEADRVVIQRGTTSAEILLKTALQPVPSGAASPRVGPAASTEQAAPQSEIPAGTRPVEVSPRAVPVYPNVRVVPRK